VPRLSVLSVLSVLSGLVALSGVRLSSVRLGDGRYVLRRGGLLVGNQRHCDLRLDLRRHAHRHLECAQCADRLAQQNRAAVNRQMLLLFERGGDVLARD
jgi:hypothetical protein